MRINKYLAEQQYASRRGADELIKQGRVFINGRLAVLGDDVGTNDRVEVRAAQKNSKNSAGMTMSNEPVYFAYNKPVDIVTHSPQGKEKDIREMIAAGSKSSPLPKGIATSSLFPVGRLDKDSHGLIILTNDGRITGKLLDPEENHEKEYAVEVSNRLPDNFESRMERGITIEDGNGKNFKTKPCIVKIIADKKFTIILTEGKKRQIRRMCETLGLQVKDLQRIRIMDIELGRIPENSMKQIKGAALEAFLRDLGVRKLRE